MLAVSVLGEAPAHAAALWGRRTCLLHAGRRMRFDELHARVVSLAGALAARGVGPGERVAICMENRAEYLISYFAVPTTGAVFVPLNTFLSTVELAAVLRDCSASTLIVSEGSLTRIASVIGDLPDLRRVLVFPGAGPAEGKPAPHGVPVARIDAFGPIDPAPTGRPMDADPEEAAVLIYTSGTTGKPKGVMLSHRNLLANARGCIRAVGVTTRDRILVCLPLFHSFTEMVGMLAPVLSGMSISLCDRLDRAEIKRTLLWQRPTLFPAVPAVFAAMSAARVGRLARLANPVRVYISGGAPLSADVLSRFESLYRRPLCEGYGLSEASPVVSFNPPNGLRKPGSVGIPLEGVELRVVDEAGRSLPTGRTGRLLVRGPNVMKGYFGNESETASAVNDGWLDTGDLAHLDRDGFLFIKGRSKEMLIFRGMNVYPREIEEVLESHPAVLEAAVIGVPDTTRGEVPHAFVVMHADRRATETELKRACMERLARYKVPRTITLLSDLPRNPAGKVVKAALRDRAAGHPSG